MILLTSGVTVTLAHHALKKNQRGKLIGWLWATVALGAVFVWFQIYEYKEAYQHLGLTLGSGIYGSTFFMLTGFHGMHVSAGVIYLLFVAFRVKRGYYDKQGGNYEIVEIAGLYWHFVDIVWVVIFTIVYLIP